MLDRSSGVALAFARNGIGVQADDEPPFPTGPEDYGLSTEPMPADEQEPIAAAHFAPITPCEWRGTEPPQQRWLASGRIPSGDLTILSGNGGAGKTEIAVQLLVSVAAELGDWLGSIVEAGPALFVSCEEPEANVRDRIERICKHRCLDPYRLPDLHLHFPDLEHVAGVRRQPDGQGDQNAAAG